TIGKLAPRNPLGRDLSRLSDLAVSSSALPFWLRPPALLELLLGTGAPGCTALDRPESFLYSVVEMQAPDSLGEFEQIVLLAILRLGDNAYGVTIGSEITACTRREPTPGALYTTLDRLEDKGLVT